MLNSNLIYWKNNGTNSRIVSEIGNLIFQCESVKIEIINDKYNIFIKHNNNNYHMILLKSYPFEIPQFVFFNNINYKKILLMNEPRINNYFKKYYGRDCFCCFSIFCKYNWKPTNNISDIINEINNTIKIKKEILLYILCDTIKNKYNCEFLYIIEYLF